MFVGGWEFLGFGANMNVFFFLATCYVVFGGRAWILHGHFYHFIPLCKELILCLVGFLSKRQGRRIVQDS